MPTKTGAVEELLAIYAYQPAQLLLAGQLSPDLELLLTSLVERRELNVTFLYDRLWEMAELHSRYGLPSLSKTVEDELLVNYLYDLEAKVKSGQLIDFVRAVSPIIYRLYLRLLTQQVPDLATYIKNARSDQYDRWLFEKMIKSDSLVIQAFISRKRDSRVTSSSLLDLLEETSLSDKVKSAARLLRQLEKNVRNPLAHLIKPFDEAELHRTTGFSSQVFLSKLIFLAKASGLTYDETNFYFDQANQVLLNHLKNDA